MKIEKNKSRGKEDSFFKIIENECFKISAQKIIHKKIIKSPPVKRSRQKAQNWAEETEGMQEPYKPNRVNQD